MECNQLDELAGDPKIQSAMRTLMVEEGESTQPARARMLPSSGLGREAATFAEERSDFSPFGGQNLPTKWVESAHDTISLGS